ncbi:MAG: SDR family NAD(P)-dependent oxidoreductase [Hamadaea sp.]|nr:SDR family NAD(P)-dependent oxidoreductase [Hamadaea sp.]
MRHVVITGTSRGLGEALLSGLLDDPATRILALGRRFTPAQEADPRVTTRSCDLSDPASLPDAAELGAFFAGATQCVLLHNAAVVEPIGAIGALDAAELTRAVAVNLTSPMLLTNVAIAARPVGVPLKVIFVSTGAAHHVIANWSAYSATKRGAEEFFAHVSSEWRDDPAVTAEIVNPGVMDTGMQETIRATDFPERQRFVDRRDRGELREPAVVAAEILAAHLPPPLPR